MSQTLEKYTYDDFGNQTGKETYEVNMDAMKTKDMCNIYDTANRL